jgi:hypothetical protein
MGNRFAVLERCHFVLRIHVCWRARTLFIIAIAPMSLGACQSLKKFGKKNPPQSDDIPPTTRYTDERPVILPPQEQRPVKSGTLPLVYLLEYPGEVRVVDATDGVVIIGTRAGGRTILKIDAENGVSIGGKTIRAGALKADHLFEIYLTNPVDNVSRNVFERR